MHRNLKDNRQVKCRSKEKAQFRKEVRKIGEKKEDRRN